MGQRLGQKSGQIRGLIKEVWSKIGLESWIKNQVRRLGQKVELEVWVEDCTSVKVVIQMSKVRD